jgi:hypothetical protein
MEWIQTMSSKYVLILLRPVTLMNVRRPATQCYQINKSNEHTEANEAGKDAELWVIQDWTFFFFFLVVSASRVFEHERWPTMSDPAPNGNTDSPNGDVWGAGLDESSLLARIKADGS